MAPSTSRPTLNPRQQLFAREYLVDLNATQAAIRAGYSKRSASSIAERLLKKPEIRRRVQAGMDRRAKRLEISADDVLKGLARVAFADMRQLFDAEGELLSPHQWPDDVAAAIAGADFVTASKGEGAVEQVAKIKANDRLRALELLGKHLVLFQDRVQHDISHDLTTKLQAARARTRASHDTGG